MLVSETLAGVDFRHVKSSMTITALQLFEQRLFSGFNDSTLREISGKHLIICRRDSSQSRAITWSLESNSDLTSGESVSVRLLYL